MEFNPCQKMLLGIAIGDAFGAGYEMQPRWKILKHFSFSKYSRKNKSKLGHYTDDTQMSIAVAELILSRQELTAENFADAFVACYQRDPHSGYSKKFGPILKSALDGKDLIAKIGGKSERNGAAMRSVPFGVFENLSDAVKYAEINAKVTHNSPKGIASSVCVAAASHYFFHKIGNSKGVFDYCIDACKGHDAESISYFKELKNMKYLEPELLFGKKDLRFGIPVDGMRTAGAMLYILSRYSESVKQTLIESVLLGGDTDSVASITTGIAAIHGNMNELPSFLVEKLENKKFGRNYLIELGNQLRTQFKK